MYAILHCIESGATPMDVELPGSGDAAGHLLLQLQKPGAYKPFTPEWRVCCLCVSCGPGSVCQVGDAAGGAAYCGTVRGASSECPGLCGVMGLRHARSCRAVIVLADPQ
jgi:hypothetical protein